MDALVPADVGQLSQPFRPCAGSGAEKQCWHPALEATLEIRVLGRCYEGVGGGDGLRGTGKAETVHIGLTPTQ